MGIFLEDGHHSRIRSGSVGTRPKAAAFGVHRGQVSARQRIYAASRACRVLGAGITYTANPQRVAGNDTGDLQILPQTTALVVRKKEQTVLNDRPSDKCPEGVAHQMRSLVRESGSNLRLFAEPVI